MALNNDLSALSPAAQQEIRRLRAESFVSYVATELGKQEEQQRVEARERAKQETTSALNKQAAVARKTVGGASPLAGLTNPDPRANPDAAAAAGAVAAVPIKA